LIYKIRTKVSILIN